MIDSDKTGNSSTAGAVSAGTGSNEARRQTAWEIALYSKYLGLAALCGRLLPYSRLPEDDRDSIDRAFADVNAVLAKRGADIRFQRSTPGSYAAFDYQPVDEVLDRAHSADAPPSQIES